jgi:hypothetical protein
MNISLKKLSALIKSRDDKNIIKYIGFLKITKEDIYFDLCHIEHYIKEKKYMDALNKLSTLKHNTPIGKKVLKKRIDSGSDIGTLDVLSIELQQLIVELVSPKKKVFRKLFKDT